MFKKFSIAFLLCIALCSQGLAITPPKPITGRATRIGKETRIDAGEYTFIFSLPSGWGLGDFETRSDGSGNFLLFPVNGGVGCTIKVEKSDDVTKSLEKIRKQFSSFRDLKKGFEVEMSLAFFCCQTTSNHVIQMWYSLPKKTKEHAKIWKSLRKSLTILHDPQPSMQDAPPSAQDVPPSAQDAPPSMQDDSPSIQDAPPSMQDDSPSIQDVPPSMQDVPPSTQDAPPSTYDVPPALNDSSENKHLAFAKVSGIEWAFYHPTEERQLILTTSRPVQCISYKEDSNSYLLMEDGKCMGYFIVKWDQPGVRLFKPAIENPGLYDQFLQEMMQDILMIEPTQQSTHDSQYNDALGFTLLEGEPFNLGAFSALDCLVGMAIINDPLDDFDMHFNMQ